jgi:exosortase
MNKNCEDKRDIKAIILDSGCDFGRCPLASRLPAALWPVVNKPAIEHLLLCLSDYGVKQTIICSDSDEKVKNAIEAGDYPMELKFSESKLPTGTAGSVRDAVCGDRSSLLLVLPASMVDIPDLETIIGSHYRGQCELTVVLNPSSKKHGYNGQATGIYVCDPAILDSIPTGGYYDIKESLVPELLRAGKNIYAARLPVPVGNFRNYSEYLCAVSCSLEGKSEKAFYLPVFEKDELKTIWKDSSSRIHASARMYGPVIVMEGAQVSEGAVVFGPTIIGRHAVIGENSLIVNSVLWDNSQVGSGCEIQGCVVGYQGTIWHDSVLNDKAVVSRSKRIMGDFKNDRPGVHENNTIELQTAFQQGTGKEDRGLYNRRQFDKRYIYFLAAAGFLCTSFVWSNWFHLKDLWDIWQRSDEYSSGLLVPFLAGYVLWLRRDRFASCIIKPSLWGLLVFAAAQAIKFFGLFFMYSSMERVSIVVSIAGLLLLLLGWGYFQKGFTVLLFLCLMLPLPVSIHSSLLLPLQSWSTASAVFCLEIMGYDVIRTGNIIDMNGTTVAVVEACNGLRMIMAFFVIGGFVVLLSKRAKWEKVVVFVSGVPIALLCNTIRLTVTAIAFTFVKGEYWEKLFHDFGGYAMMPLAIGVIVFEFWLLEKIVPVRMENQIVPDQQSGPKPFIRG